MNVNEESIFHVLTDYLDRNDLTYSVLKRNILELNMRIGGNFGAVRVLICPGDGRFCTYAFSKLHADPKNPEQMGKISLFLNMANAGLRSGNFDLDVRDGEIRYKVYVDCSDSLPGDETIDNAIGIAVGMIRRHASTLIQLIATDIPLKEAMKMCECCVNYSNALPWEEQPQTQEDGAHFRTQLRSLLSMDEEFDEDEEDEAEPLEGEDSEEDLILDFDDIPRDDDPGDEDPGDEDSEDEDSGDEDSGPRASQDPTDTQSSADRLQDLLSRLFGDDEGGSQ